MSVVPEWAREVLDVLIFIASESVASVISVIALNLKAFKILKKNKIILFKNWNHAEEELRTKSFAWMYFHGRKNKRNSVETKINLLKN